MRGIQPGDLLAKARTFDLTLAALSGCRS